MVYGEVRLGGALVASGSSERRWMLRDHALLGLVAAKQRCAALSLSGQQGREPASPGARESGSSARRGGRREGAGGGGSGFAQIPESSTVLSRVGD
jgi:hypothetical protein